MRKWRVEARVGFGNEECWYVLTDDTPPIVAARAWDEEWGQFIVDACNAAEARNGWNGSVLSPDSGAQWFVNGRWEPMPPDEWDRWVKQHTNKVEA